jgi:ankyrin repeat protein
MKINLILYNFFSFRYYQTPLIYASRNGKTKLVECLFKLNADLNAKDDNDWTVIKTFYFKTYP